MMSDGLLDDSLVLWAVIYEFLTTKISIAQIQIAPQLICPSATPKSRKLGVALGKISETKLAPHLFRNPLHAPAYYKDKPTNA